MISEPNATGQPTSFFSRLEQRVRSVDSLLCVGLDAHGYLLEENTPEGARNFCLRLIEATHSIAAAYKPNTAFFEAFGAEGWSALREVIEAVPQDVPVILDAKRGDIASTAEAYAQAAFETLGADAVTLNPYLGYDALQPFLQRPEKGVFLLCKTSNPSAADVQEARVIAAPEEGIQAHPGQPLGMPLYEYLACLVGRWNLCDNLGLVVGANQPQALIRVRHRLPSIWILAPGIGAQGGDLETALRAGLRQDGLGLLLNVSRSLAQSDHPARTARLLRQAISRVRDELGSPPKPARGYTSRAPEGMGLPHHLRLLADALLERGCVKFGEFKLKSGRLSPIYFDLRLLVSYAPLLRQVAEAYLPLLQSLSFQRLAAIPYAGLPIGTAVSLMGGWPLIYPRKEVKGYGTRAAIEGEYKTGEEVVVLDDLATTGESKFEAIDTLVAAGLHVRHVVVLIDRQSGAKEALQEKGYRLHAVLKLDELLDYWQQSGKVADEVITSVRRFLREEG